MKTKTFVLYAVPVLFLFLGLPLGAQEETGDSIPRKFRNISLGMSLDDLKESLKNDHLFSFRGDRDVSLLPNRDQSLVETTGLSFIRRAFFQLREGSVFIMAFSLDPRLVDHYSVYTTMVKQYGQPSQLDPVRAVWENDETRLTIERPLTVKYIDKQVFNSLVEESKTSESAEIRRREDFLNEF